MNEVVVPPEAAAKKDPLERPQRLATLDGGGVIFPNGFYGPGVYLPEWEYLRYRTRADHWETDPERLTWWQRHIERPSRNGEAAKLIGCIGLAILFNYYVDDQIEMNVIWSLVAGFLLWRIWMVFHTGQKELAEAFPSAMPLAFWSYWRERLLSVMPDTRTTNYLNGIWSCFLGIAIAGFVLHEVSEGEVHFFIAILAVPLFLVTTTYPLFLLGCIAFARLRLGRPATAGDIASLPPPTPFEKGAP